MLTLGQTLVGERDLPREEVEAETVENAAERRDGDEAVSCTRLEKNKNEQNWHSVWALRNVSLKIGALCWPWQKLRFFWSDSLSSRSWSPWPVGSPPTSKEKKPQTMVIKRHNVDVYSRKKDWYWRGWAAPELAPGYRRWPWPPHKNSTAARSHDQTTPVHQVRQRENAKEQYSNNTEHRQCLNGSFNWQYWWLLVFVVWIYI